MTVIAYIKVYIITGTIKRFYKNLKMLRFLDTVVATYVTVLIGFLNCELNKS
jgi:hypothetical protein